MREYKGALLKPGERSARKQVSEPRRMSTTVDKTKSRFDHLKQVVRSGLQTAFEVGAALLEIREDELYKKEFDTFEAFCEAEFKIVRRRAYQLIEAAQVKAALPEELCTMVHNERQARALAKASPEERADVLEAAAKRGAVTAKSIDEIVHERPHPSRWTNLPTQIQSQVKSGKMSVGEANALYDANQRASESSHKEEAPLQPERPKLPEKHLDKTGYPIPEAVLIDWHEAEEFRLVLNDLQRIKLDIEKALESKSKPLRFLDQSFLIDLKNAWTALKEILPYAVCPTCQGRTRSKCSVCKELGYVPQFGYQHWFPKEIIEIRERAIKE